MKSLFTFLFAALSTGALSGNTVEPLAPALQWLYTSFVELSTPIDVGDAPHGRRIIFPITGGNFSGPNMNGTITNLGADWAQIINGTTYTDTRYHLVTSDGGQIFVRSEGATDDASGNIPGRFKFETGSPKYRWLNKAIVIGVGKMIETNVAKGKGVLRIDTWSVKST